MDFVTDLPESNGYDAIWVVVDRLTKMAHFIPCRKDMDTKQFIQLFLRTVFKHHGLPRDIVTDRGSIFTSDLWKEMTKGMEIRRKLSTAFHPQTDGQTERVNAIMEQLLRGYVEYSQQDWEDWLAFAEFAYNNTLQETTKTTPFFANYGYHPAHEEMCQETTARILEREDMSQLHDIIRTEMIMAQETRRENADKHRKPDPCLKSGDKVWLKAKDLNTTRPSRKLDYKKWGPYDIVEKIGQKAYKLALPPSANKKHPVFHISKLELYHNDAFPSQKTTPPPPIEIAGEEEYELDEVIDSRLRYNKLQYRAKWTGYPPEHDLEWYPAENFANSNHAIARFHSSHPYKPGPTPDPNESSIQPHGRRRRH